MGPDTEFDYVHENEIRYIKSKTPYKAEEFRQITKRSLPPMHCEEEDGYISGMYVDGAQ